MKILMVCLGNICRSPLAEGILLDKINKAGLIFTVDSAGTGGWHAGELPDRRSISKAKEHGIDISYQRARKFKTSDFEDFDVIYVMDRSNFSDVSALTTNVEYLKKIKLILNETNPGMNLDVPDPYYGGDDGFENVYQLLDKACQTIIDKYHR